MPLWILNRISTLVTCLILLALPRAKSEGVSPNSVIGESSVRVQQRLELNFNFYLQRSCKDCVQRAKQVLASYGCGDLRDPSTQLYLRYAHFIEAECRSKNGLEPDRASQEIVSEYPGLFVSVERNFKCNFLGEEPTAVGTGHDATFGLNRQLIRGITPRESLAPLSREKQLFPDVYEYWNLDRIDQVHGGFDKQALTWRFDRTFDYGCFPKEGKGATVYVVDTGCNVHHEDLTGRAEEYADPLRFSSSGDDNGHGTHVAAIAAGKYSGVCKKCNIVCVKAVGSNGEGSSGDIVAAMDWIIERHERLKRQTPQSLSPPAVAVLAVAARGSAVTIDEGVQRLSEAGIVPVVAAANHGMDACDFTPARSPFAVTVGATDLSDYPVRDSNWGSCVNMMSPGYSVKSAGHTANNDYDVRTGTSQATPAVAGVIALILAEKTISQAQAVRLASHGGLSIGSSHGDLSFTYPLVHIQKKHCEDYGFPKTTGEGTDPGCEYDDDFSDLAGVGDQEDPCSGDGYQR